MKFTCEMCEGTFDMGSDDEARDELEQSFGEVAVEDCAMVCDDCYEEVSP